MSFESMVEFTINNELSEVQVSKTHITPDDPIHINRAKKYYLDRKGVRAYSGHYTLGADNTKNRQIFDLARLFDMDLLVIETPNLNLFNEIDKLAQEFQIQVAILVRCKNSGAPNTELLTKIQNSQNSLLGICLEIASNSLEAPSITKLFQDFKSKVWDVHFTPVSSLPSNSDPSAENPELNSLAEAMKKADWNGIFALKSDANSTHKDTSRFLQLSKKLFRQHFIHSIFRVSVAKTDITPTKPEPMRGYPNPRIWKEIHDRIYHRILVMDDGEEKLSSSPPIFAIFLQQPQTDSATISRESWASHALTSGGRSPILILPLIMGFVPLPHLLQSTAKAGIHLMMIW